MKAKIPYTLFMESTGLIAKSKIDVDEKTSVGYAARKFMRQSPGIQDAFAREKSLHMEAFLAKHGLLEDDTSYKFLANGRRRLPREREDELQKMIIEYDSVTMVEFEKFLARKLPKGFNYLLADRLKDIIIDPAAIEPDVDPEAESKPEATAE